MKKLLVSVLILSTTLFFTGTSPAYAAGTIGFDDATFTDGGGGSFTVTDTHTADGSNRLAVVCLRAGGLASPTQADPTVTYDGVSMTMITGSPTYGGFERIWMFYLIDPPTTSSASVVATFNINTPTYNIKTATYTGVAQASALDTSGVTGPSSTGTFTQTLTTSVDNTWMMTCVRSGSALTASTNAVIRTGSVYIEGDTNADQPTGSNSMTYTQSVDNVMGIAAAFKPVVSAAPTFKPWFFWAF